MKKKINLIITTLILSLINCNIYAMERTELIENSQSAILIDYSTGKILYEKDPYLQLAPASMTKIASMLIIMEAVEKNQIKFEDTVTISENAQNMGGSQVYLEQGESYSVSELLKAVAISSANDAVVALAEKVGGSVESFVNLMNDKCKEIGCKDTNFVNPHGLDAENHYSTAYDMSLLAKELLNYEEILNYTSLYEDYLKRNDGSQTWMVNTNKLLRYYQGVDGLKTGYTENAGYCLTSTVLKNDFRLITVVMNSESSEKRSEETIKLIDYGYNNYSIYLIKEKQDSIGSIEVSNAKVETVDIYLSEDAVDLKNIADSNKTYEITYDIKEISAPIYKNDIIGEANVTDNEGNLINKIDIIVKEDLEKAKFKDYLFRNFKTIISGK